MYFLSEKIVKKLIEKKITISVCESCTGGLLSSAITSINGSSKVFSLGLVTYSNQSKSKIVKVLWTRSQTKRWEFIEDLIVIKHT